MRINILTVALCGMVLVTTHVAVSGPVAMQNLPAFIVPVEVVKLKPEPPDFHLVAWFNKGKLSDVQFDAMCDLALEHHLEPLTKSELTALWSTNSPNASEQRVQSLMKKGQRIFQINKPDPALYAFLEKKGWLDIALFESAVRKYGSKVKAFVSPVPDVFQHPHYYDRLPETLLKKREDLLRSIRELEGR